MVEKQAKTAFVLGFISLIAWILPLAGYPVCIIGLVMGIIGARSFHSKGKAVAGIIMCSVGLLLTLINSFLGILLQMQ